MHLNVTQTDGGYRLEGELDMATAGELSALLQGTGNGRDPILLDFAGITFMDSSGLRALLEAADVQGGGVPLVILHPAPQVQRVLDISIPDGMPGLEVRP